MGFPVSDNFIGLFFFIVRSIKVSVSPFEISGRLLRQTADDRNDHVTMFIL